MTFEGGGPPELVPEQRLDAVHHYFLGDDPAAWRTDVPLYGAVRYRGIHRGVDVRAREHDGHFEFDVLLAPDADLGRVEVAVEGIDGMHLADDGSLVLETAVGPVRMPAPPSWEAGPSGEQQPIACEYELRGARRFGFTVPGRRPGWALVVDPGLIWSTRLGGSLLDSVGGLALDAQGAVTCGGVTRSASDFPVSPGALQASLNGTEDAFLAKLSSDGSTLLWATFFGGSAEDNVGGLHLGQFGITVSGGTTSSDLPTTSGAFDTTYNGMTDTYVARFAADGSALTWSTYLGGMGDDSASPLAVDATGSAAPVGTTDSADFPTTPGAFDTSINGGPEDAFVTRLLPDGSGLIGSTYLGGAARDRGIAVEIDPGTGAVYAGGDTLSPGFPTTPTAFMPTHSNPGNADGFVTLLAPDLSNVSSSTFLGGATARDHVHDLALDSANGDVVVLCSVQSTDLPTTSGVYQPNHAGRLDAGVTRFSPNLASPVWSTLFGGSGAEQVTRLAVDGRGAPVVTGTVSTPGVPTTPGAFMVQFPGGRPGFLFRLSPDGTQLEYSTHFGGSARFGELPKSLALDAQGVATIGGFTRSPDFPTTPGAYRTSPLGFDDGFVARLDLVPFPAPVLTAISPTSVPNHASPPTEITLNGSWLRNTMQVSVGTQSITSFNVDSSTQIRFRMPDPAVIGPAQPVTVTTDTGTSNALGLTVQALNPPVLEVPQFGARGFPVNYRMFGDPGSSSLLVISTLNSPSVVPGVVNLGIGNNFSFLLSAGTFLHDNRGFAQTSIVYPTFLPTCTHVYAQAIHADLANLVLPLVTTAVRDTKLF